VAVTEPLLSSSFTNCPSQRRAVLAAALPLALVLGGCSSLFPPPQTAQLSHSPPPGLPPRVERTEVPFFPQTPHHCGPAALATVLKHAGIEATPEQLDQTIFLPAREGTLQTEMLVGARRAGAMAVRVPKELNAVLREVAAGNPVVVLQNLGLSVMTRWHYAVVVGYDLGRGEIILRSGTVQREVMSLGTFEHTWKRGEYWAFVALPPGKLPVTAHELESLQATVAFERVAPAAQAARAYEAALSRWPGSLVAAIGVGNTRFNAGDIAGAATAFEAAARRHDSAAAWNNLAQARLKLGQRTAALDAAQRAVQRAETAEKQWVEAARTTLRQAASPK
jgi:hypothetical protein